MFENYTLEITNSTSRDQWLNNQSLFVESDSAPFMDPFYKWFIGAQFKSCKNSFRSHLSSNSTRPYSSMVGVTKASFVNFSIRKIFNLAKVPVEFLESHSYLTDRCHRSWAVMTPATLWTSNGKKGSVKWRCEHAQSRGFLGNFVNLHSATS